MNKLFVPYFGAAVILTLVFGTMYAAIQQSQRRDANYPQIQLAEDAASELNNHALPSDITSGKVNIATSLAPFVTVYDTSGRIVTSSGYIGITTPSIPRGVLTAANDKPYHTVTWQPQSNVRIAAVAVAANNYYVLSGRSLTEVEKNEIKTMQLSALGWFASMLILALTCAVQHKLSREPTTDRR